MPSPQDLPATTPPAGTPQAPRKVDLRGKKKRFADAYLLNFSEIEAAKAAGAPISKERVFARKMMDDPAVTTYITRKIAETESGIRPTQLRVMDEMMAIATACPAYDLHGDGEKKGQLRRLRLDKIDPRTIQQLSVRQHQHGTDVTLKFHPKADMLKTIGQINGLVTDEGAPPRRVEIIFNGPTQINAGAGGRK